MCFKSIRSHSINIYEQFQSGNMDIDGHRYFVVIRDVLFCTTFSPLHFCLHSSGRATQLQRAVQPVVKSAVELSKKQGFWCSSRKWRTRRRSRRCYPRRTRNSWTTRRRHCRCQTNYACCASSCALIGLQTRNSIFSIYVSKSGDSLRKSKNSIFLKENTSILAGKIVRPMRAKKKKKEKRKMNKN